MVRFCKSLCWQLSNSCPWKNPPPKHLLLPLSLDHPCCIYTQIFVKLLRAYVAKTYACMHLFQLLCWRLVKTEKGRRMVLQCADARFYLSLTALVSDHIVSLPTETLPAECFWTSLPHYQCFPMLCSHSFVLLNV